MAEGQPRGTGNKLAPYPSNWGKMTAGQKREWSAKNRPQPPVTPRPAEAPRPAPTPSAAEYQPADEYPPTEQPGGQEQGQEQPCEQCADTLRLTIQIPGQDVREMSGKQIIAAMLRSLADGLSGEEYTE